MTTDDSSPPPAYDAQKMSEPKKETGTTGSAPESLRYVYYRVYSPDGAIPSKTAFEPRNPFVGRIPARSVPPPHNVTSLKRCLAKAENFADPDGSRTVLYPRLNALSTLSLKQTVTILGPEMPNGGAPAWDTAFALVLPDDLTADENAAINRMDMSGLPRRRQGSSMNRSVYYRLFTQTGEDTSKVLFNSNEPALGRIERIHVSPSHGTASIKRHIAKVEGKPIYAYAELYEDISAQCAMDNKYFSLMKSDSAGWAEDKPMILVQPERRLGLYNRPVKVLSDDGLHFSFHPSIGALGHTDGVPTYQLFISGLGEVKAAYKCIFAGKHGYLPTNYIKFLDE
ncbi:hypothetical protein B0H19DRAFT_1262678 [Mycena capillaripes]|nr:hypothetical protein B0H19DRAFT_1262678 [Mycena capillaripes]